MGRVVCVFCGSSPGNSPAYLAAARALAHIFHKENVTLVYGGGTTGLMGEIARTLVSLAGPESVLGIIPSALIQFENGQRNKSGKTSDILPGKEPERTISADSVVADANVKGTEPPLIRSSEYGMTMIVSDMHTRKRMMASKVLAGGPGSGFIALPGGFGTLEEAMEITTWNQIGIHQRGIVLLNIDGYWDEILAWIDKSVEHGFVASSNKNILVQRETAEGALEALKAYKVSSERLELDWGTMLDTT